MNLSFLFHVENRKINEIDSGGVTVATYLISLFIHSPIDEFDFLN